MYLGITFAVGVFLAGNHIALAAESVYGALFEVGNLQADAGSNDEVVLMYYPSEDGFIALTKNDDGVEWWTSDKFGLKWTRNEDNPLADENCMQPGRHTVEEFNDTMYVGLTCESGAIILKLTSLTDGEIIHTRADEEAAVESLAEQKQESIDDKNEEKPEDEVKGEQPNEDENGCPDEENENFEEDALEVKSLAEKKQDPKQEPKEDKDEEKSEDEIKGEQPSDDSEEKTNGENNCDNQGENGPGNGGNMASGYPTGAVLGDELFMFYDGGYTVCDTDDFCTDVTDAEDQPESVALEASSEYNGNIYLPFTTGEVMAFDGVSYTQIGENYFDSDATNLPAAEVYNGNLYVGTDMNGDGNGAAIFRYDLEDETAEWELVAQLGEKNNIINKMQVSDEVDGASYLVYYTANAEEGTNILALDENEEEINLIDAGLGGENPENNSEVISVLNRVIDDNGEEKTVMLFGTKNEDDEGKVFALQLGADLAMTPTQDQITTSSDFSLEITRKLQSKEKGKNKGKTKVKKGDKGTTGSIFEVLLAKTDLVVGDVYTLYVNGKKVDRVKVKSTKKDLTLEYRRSKSLKKGQKMTVQVGRNLAYGSGKKTVLSRNVVTGDKLNITVSSVK